MDIGSAVEFTKFDGGTPVRAVGALSSVGPDEIVLRYADRDVRFRRAPGPRAGYGVGSAKFWRLGAEARKELCLPDLPSKRR